MEPPGFCILYRDGGRNAVFFPLVEWLGIGHNLLDNLFKV
jgi:hypothetical protein